MIHRDPAESPSAPDLLLMAIASLLMAATTGAFALWGGDRINSSADQAFGGILEDGSVGAAGVF